MNHKYCTSFYLHLQIVVREYEKAYFIIGFLNAFRKCRIKRLEDISMVPKGILNLGARQIAIFQNNMNTFSEENKKSCW